MNILLLRHHPSNDRFGLGPFFRVEPLGLEYIAAALLGTYLWNHLEIYFRARRSLVKV